MILIVPGRRGLAVLAVLAGLAVAIGPSLTSASVPAPPSEFVAISQGAGNPPAMTMGLYSSSTGALTRRLATFSETTFTNNGLAFTPDRGAVYFTLIPRHAERRFYLRLMRLDVATRRQTFIADGAQPAISDDGTELAYATFPHGLAVRDLAAGQTRTIGLVTELGRAANLLDATTTWLADGSEVAIIPSAPAWDLVGHRPPPARWCGTTDAHAVVVFVHVPAPPAPLSADCVHLGGIALTPAIALSGSQSYPSSLLLATDTDRDSTRIERIPQTGTTTRMLTIRDSLPLAFDPTGTHLLYLVGHSPPVLWEATIADGHLSDRRRLPKRSWGPIAW